MISLSFVNFVYIIIKLSFFYVYGEKYFIRMDGSDNVNCNTLNTACSSIDYVLQNLVNVSGKESDIYISSGDYNVSFACGVVNDQFGNPTYYDYKNINLNISGYSLYSNFLLSSSFSFSNDVDFYPFLNSINSSDNFNVIFLFSSNCTAYFKYLNFVFSNFASLYQIFFKSLFIFFNLFICFYLFIFFNL
jgi:hypothetical protein